MALYYQKNQFFDDNGDPLADGLVYTYITNTSTPKVAYTDSTEGSEHPNPVELDSAGRADIWLAEDAEYRLKVYTAGGIATGTQVGSTLDNISGVGIAVGAFSTLVSDLDTDGHVINGSGSISLTGSIATTSTITGAGLSTNNGATGPGFIDVYEDSDNGSNKIQIIAPSSIASDKTLTLQDVTGTVLCTNGTDVPVADGGTGASDAATAVSNLGLSNMSASGEILSLPSGAAGPSQVKYFEDTDNGSNYTTVKAPSSLADNTGSLTLPTVAVTMPTALPSSTSMMTITSGGTVSNLGLPSAVYLGELNEANSYASTSILSGYGKYLFVVSSGSSGIVSGSNSYIGFQLYVSGAYVTSGYSSVYYGVDDAGGAVAGISGTTSSFILAETTSGGAAAKVLTGSFILDASYPASGTIRYQAQLGNVQLANVISYVTFSGRINSTDASNLTGIKLLSAASLTDGGGGASIAVFGLVNS